MLSFGDRTRAVVCALLGVFASSCASLHATSYYPRPNALVGEWVDESHTTAADTSLWILRGDGYDGSAHILVERSASGGATTRRTQTHFGSWYFSGDLADTAHREICFARRLGRDGGTCLAFSFDSVGSGSDARRRLLIHAYHGEHHTGDRELVERRVALEQMK